MVRTNAKRAMKADQMPWMERFSLYLAPMAGVTDPIFRSLCKEKGADVLETEFVSAAGVLQAWERTRRYVQLSDVQRPVGVQIFGAEPEQMAAAARIIVDSVHPDFIDINAGCPVPKVVGRNGGASLMKDLPLLERIARAVVQELGEDCPVTAKIRSGWDAGSICAVEACMRLENAGVRSITVHGRTRSQQYSGMADWDIVHECAHSVHIPIIGNGDLRKPEDILRERDKGIVAGVMIGRAAMSSPWIFRHTRHLLNTGERLPEPTSPEKLNLVLHYAKLTLDSGHYGDEITTMRALRARILSLTKGIPGTKEKRSALARVCSWDELQNILASLS